MFTDEIYEKLLVDDNRKLTFVHKEVCKEKLNPDKPSLQDIRKIEMGYQLFRKRHPEYPEDSFRRYCYVQWSHGGQDAFRAQQYFSSLNWPVKFEYDLIGR